jgi:4-aminobutyrate aminotransferase/(S)-3-amino-2-methylpropionate transaminase
MADRPPPAASSAVPLGASEDNRDERPLVQGPLPGPRTLEALEQLAVSECPALTMRRKRRGEISGASHDPIVWASARDCHVWDADGNRFVDLTAGFGASSLGHGHPEVVSAVQRQASTLMHALGDVHPSEVKIALLHALAAVSPWPEARVILGLSGADAIEAALKTATLYTRKPGIIAFERSYHGLSFGALAVTGYSAAFRVPFLEQLNPHVHWAPYPRAGESQRACNAEVDAALARIEELLATHRTIGAVLIEPVLGRGGVVIPPDAFLPQLRALCDARRVLLIADEILTGLGRCGVMWRSVAQGAVPDLICTGKALGNGMPISACLGRREVFAAWGAPDHEAIHTSTFNGHPVSCAAALATLNHVRLQRLHDDVQARGDSFADLLRREVGTHPLVRDVRATGLMLGVQLRDGVTTLGVLRQLLEAGHIALVAGADASVLSLTPPFCITDAQQRDFARALRYCLEAR